MATPGRLSHPPIQEALVDLRVLFEKPFGPEVFDPLGDALRDRYPKREIRNKFEANIHAAPEPKVEARVVGFHGLFLTSAPGSHIAQFRLDGMTLSQLANYSSAEVLVHEAMDLWQRYTDVVPEHKIMRAAFRYINRLKLPFRSGDDFTRFIVAPAQSPDEVAVRGISEFLSRVVMNIDDETSSIVTQRLGLSDKDEQTPYTLDIDVIKAAALDSNPEALRKVFAELRVIKNSMFFSSVTDEALEPYR